MNRSTNIKSKSMLIVVLVAGLLMSCNTEESCSDLGTCPETALIERTDIIIDGALSINDHQLYETFGPKDGPVNYNYYGNPSASFDFLVELSSGHTLTIRLTNESSMSPWNDVDVPYNVYPTHELEDKYSYVTADLKIGNDAASYSTNLGEHLPQGTKIDAFKIISNDGDVIKCRIRDLVLYKNTNSSQSIVVNGTFNTVIAYDGELAGSGI